ncbi:unnamed protein product [Ostreobium quekettii]|uniref:DNA replication licensing factor MCM7 n=1 Tax=Ostreobium quekettii TaxID=121088 RepID=A0A8S1J803_9CHLO|nr:unnamed protein product [Ostreobium quekettii]
MQQNIANREQKTLDIYLDDLHEFFAESDPEFSKSVEHNSRRYVKLFCEAADSAMPAPTRSDIAEDIFDVIADEVNQYQQKERLDQLMMSGQLPAEDPNQGQAMRADMPGVPINELPPALLRRFDVCLKMRGTAPLVNLRAVSSAHVGSLVAFKGIVTYMTDVKPLIRIATYVDNESGQQVYQEVTGRSFMPLQTAPQSPSQPSRPSCLQLEPLSSKFVKFQELKVQEMAEEVPEGSTPRALTVHCTGDLTRLVKPGDQVVISGVLCPQPYTGFRALRAGLVTSTFIEAMEIKVDKVSYTKVAVSDDDQEMIQQLRAEGNVYNRLSQSIAPEIFGHEDVKKALLLLMVGGVTNELGDGMKLRGDIHMCLMGDPGVAKSQLLKHIVNISPRAVYSTGKGSSGVGLTAAVVRDPVTNDFILEGGALVLADKGICCIDEFDKMDEGDRTAIHEVMEQQTVSIAKAGVTTTLNARTTVLAAANPAMGRYDPRRSPTENIALPAALLSRFDLMWLILDRPEEDTDAALADHVLKVHKTGEPPAPEDFEPLTPRQLRAYIRAAKQYRPTVPDELTEYIAGVYAELRSDEQKTKVPHSYTTPRTLMSILRLSQALAKLRFASTVVQSDVDEALRLMKMSKSSLSDRRGQRGRQDPVSAVYRRMNDHWRRDARARRHGIPFAKIRELCTGLVTDREGPGALIRQCLEEYSDLGVIVVQRDASGQEIVRFIE